MTATAESKPPMGKFFHEFANVLENLNDGEKYTRLDISSLGLCAFLHDGRFCCKNKKGARGKLCKEHATALAKEKDLKKQAQSVAKQATQKKPSRAYRHARWDELDGVSIDSQQLVTSKQVFEFGYCTFVDQDRFCCAQRLDSDERNKGVRLCHDHAQRVRSEQEKRAAQHQRQQERRVQEQRAAQEKRKAQALKRIADSVILAPGCPDSPEIRMRVARRILAQQGN